jgi:AcrR family transcriptional regulator
LPRRASSDLGPSRRDEILRASAQLFAEHGYRSVTLGQLGAAVGISGPGVYRHFASKEDVLAELLVAVSENLLAEANARVEGMCDPTLALRELVAFHVGFAIDNAELIVVQARELNALELGAQRKVRQLQRRYVELWANLIGKLHPQLSGAEALATAHGIFGLINSVPRMAKLEKSIQHELLCALAKGALAL